LWATGIVSAIVPIDTEQLATRDTIAQVAVVSSGADVAIVAKGNVESSYTTNRGVADVVGAGVVIIAVGFPGTGA
jgi:hypothetical protein